jgi:hypothetical protein
LARATSIARRIQRSSSESIVTSAAPERRSLVFGPPAETS